MQRRGPWLRRYVRAVAAVQRAAGLVGGSQGGDGRVQRADLPFAGGLRHDVSLGVDQDERGPGPHRVLLPEPHFGIVQDRMVHLVTLHCGADSGGLGLVRELG